MSLHPRPPLFRTPALALGACLVCLLACLSGCGNSGTISTAPADKSDVTPGGAINSAAWDAVCQREGLPSGCDLCARLGWYYDGVCDSFCPNPDPDCSSSGDGGSSTRPDGGSVATPDGGSVATPDGGSVATPDGGSCTPSCTGRICGDDGCGGSCGSCATGQTCNASGQCEGSTTTATIFQDFEPWTGSTSPDGVWRLAGPWAGTGGNQFDLSRELLSSTFDGASGGYLSLISKASTLNGGEIQTITTPGYGYGYYEVRMKVTEVPGVCASFFWIEAPSYGPHEWDYEFLTNESWITSANSGRVWICRHPGDCPVIDLAFNPSKGFHRYGFLWQAGKMDYTVDGQVAHSVTDSNLTTTAKGFIMMNSWTGNASWGGGPPTQDATTVYDWVKFYDGATEVQ
jgi:hypothetical protein